MNRSSEHLQKLYPTATPQQIVAIQRLDSRLDYLLEEKDSKTKCLERLVRDVKEVEEGLACTEASIVELNVMHMLYTGHIVMGDKD